MSALRDRVDLFTLHGQGLNSMIPIEQTPTGMLVFLRCGCAALRLLTHPTGAAALVTVQQACDTHSGDHVRSVPRGEMVSPFVRTPVSLDSITTFR